MTPAVIENHKVTLVPRYNSEQMPPSQPPFQSVAACPTPSLTPFIPNRRCRRRPRPLLNGNNAADTDGDDDADNGTTALFRSG